MILVLDTENTTWNKGNPFDQRNFNVCISYATDDGRKGVLYDEDRGSIRALIDEATTLVGFNLKYDLHWLRRLGFDFSGKRIWCCQAGAFVLGRQLNRYPSLEGECAAHSLGNKLSVVEEEYWNKGINTHEIPRSILSEYALQDVELTYKLYLKQQELIQPHQRTLLSLVMQDLQVLQEMEWNGLFFDKEEANKKAAELESQISKLQQELALYHTVPCFNWASNDHLSALLYGGTIHEARRVPIGVYKTGAKAGEPRFQIETVEHKLPRRYAPIKGSENKKEGYWSVDESYLTRLKGKKDLLDGILKIKGMQKQLNTYFRGLPELHSEMHWEENIIHGQFNQCVARTGRLSSSRPNLQNLDDDAQSMFTSRYNDSTIPA